MRLSMVLIPEYYNNQQTIKILDILATLDLYPCFIRTNLLTILLTLYYVRIFQKSLENQTNFANMQTNNK